MLSCLDLHTEKTFPQLDALMPLRQYDSSFWIGQLLVAPQGMVPSSHSMDVVGPACYVAFQHSMVLTLGTVVQCGSISYRVFYRSRDVTV